jgi:hypothetical protein
MFWAKIADVHRTHSAQVVRFSRQLNGSHVYVTSSHTPGTVAVRLTPLSRTGALEPTTIGGPTIVCYTLCTFPNLFNIIS